LIRPSVPSFISSSVCFIVSFFKFFLSPLHPFEFCFRFYFVPLPVFIISSSPFSFLPSMLVIGGRWYESSLCAILSNPARA
jgi:hypothetical protein